MGGWMDGWVKHIEGQDRYVDRLVGDRYTDRIDYQIGR